MKIELTEDMVRLILELINAELRHRSVWGMRQSTDYSSEEIKKLGTQLTITSE